MKQKQFAISTELKVTILLWNGRYNAAIKNLVRDESLENKPQGRPAAIVENEVLKTIIEENTSRISRDSAKMICGSHSAILRHLHDIGKNLVPYEQSEKKT